jgi:hypothetical protein
LCKEGDNTEILSVLTGTFVTTNRVENVPHVEQMGDNMKISINGAKVLRVRTDGGHL